MQPLRAVVPWIAAGTLWAAAAGGFPGEAAGSTDPIQRLQEAAYSYTALRSEVTQALPPMEMSPDAGNFLAAAGAMADAIRAARPLAAEGDLINGDAAALLRQRIRDTLGDRGCTVAEILARERNDQRRPPPPRPIVHDQFDWAAGAFMPACLLGVLPSMPEELQFRFVQRDLVLVDVAADLVVDVLPDALPPAESWKGVRYASR